MVGVQPYVFADPESCIGTVTAASSSFLGSQILNVYRVTASSNLDTKFRSFGCSQKMSSDEDEGLSFPSIPLQSRPKLGRIDSRRKSVGQEPSQPFDSRTTLAFSDTDNGSPKTVDTEWQTRVKRSISNANVLDCKAQWSAELLSQSCFQDAREALEKDIASHEKEATGAQWDDLLLVGSSSSEFALIALESGHLFLSKQMVSF